MYFLARVGLGRRNYFLRITLVCFMFLAILACGGLIFKLFYYYLTCITLGWIFIITPFTALSYYALFQAIAFLSVSCYKLITADVIGEIGYANITNFEDFYTWLFSGARGYFIYFTAMTLCTALTWILCSSKYLGDYQLSWGMLTSINQRLF